MKAKTSRWKRVGRVGLRALRRALKKGARLNVNQLARSEQLRHGAVLAAILGISVGFYYASSNTKAAALPKEDISFDGVFDESFNQGSDEALLEKQQTEINTLKSEVSENAKIQKEALTARAPDADTQAALKAMQEKLETLEEAHQKTNEQLQVALLQNAQSNATPSNVTPPTREEQLARRMQRQAAEREIYRNAGLATVQFNSRKKPQTEERTHKNYVWAGTFVEGVLLTGILGDAGINGSKNMGTAMIRLTAPGIMPNEQHSHLEGCFVLVSSYGDLSGSSVVLHLETLSCAGKSINFEQRTYGSVFDLDAMQDLRGTSILKTKPLLGYSAAAGILAGFGDGLKNYNTAQAVNPSAGTITTYGTGAALAQSAAGGALSNPANRISDYVMKIADIYHPLVVARAGRRVSVLFTKGFWIDKEHQVYESGRAIDEANTRAMVTTTVSRADGSRPQDSLTEPSETNAHTENLVASSSRVGSQDFMQQKNSSLPLFTTVQNGVTPHG